MLACDGYKMFHGSVKITPVNGRPPFDLTGTWLFKPETGGMWFCKPDQNGRFAEGYPEDILSDFRDDEEVLNNG